MRFWRWLGFFSGSGSVSANIDCGLSIWSRVFVDPKSRSHQVRRGSMCQVSDCVYRHKCCFGTLAAEEFQGSRPRLAIPLLFIAVSERCRIVGSVGMGVVSEYDTATPHPPPPPAWPCSFSSRVWNCPWRDLHPHRVSLRQTREGERRRA